MKELTRPNSLAVSDPDIDIMFIYVCKFVDWYPLHKHLDANLGLGQYLFIYLPTFNFIFVLHSTLPSH